MYKVHFKWDSYFYVLRTVFGCLFTNFNRIHVFYRLLISLTMPCIPEDCGENDYNYRYEAAKMVHITRLERLLKTLNQNQPPDIQKSQTYQETQHHNHHQVQIHPENVYEVLISKSTPGTVKSTNRIISNWWWRI